MISRSSCLALVLAIQAWLTLLLWVHAENYTSAHFPPVLIANGNRSSAPETFLRSFSISGLEHLFVQTNMAVHPLVWCGDSALPKGLSVQ